jgi:hypothetical protein
MNAPVTLEKTIERMKREIVEDVLTGHVPLNCATFGELHGYRDANEFGGFCEDGLADSMIRYFGGRDTEDGMPDGMLSYINQAQEAVNDWLAEGGLVNACPPPGWKPFYSDVDHLNRSGLQDFDSVFEKRIGGHGFPTCDLTVLSDGHAYRAAHGSVVMPERVDSAKAAAVLAMTWAVENGWSTEKLNAFKPESIFGELPVPAFSIFLDHASDAEHKLHAALLRAAPHLVEGGMWSGKVLDVEHGVVIQKINRDGNTVQHDATKLSAMVNVGDVVDIKYVGALGVVSGLTQGLQGVGR